MLRGSGESGRPCLLVPAGRGGLLALSMMVAVGFRNAFCQVPSVPSSFCFFFNSF